jgi:hypothetical protein
MSSGDGTADFTASWLQKTFLATFILMTATTALSHSIVAITIGSASLCNFAPHDTSVHFQKT